MDETEYDGVERRTVPQPLTEEQLAFFTEQTRDAVNKTLRRYVLGALVGFTALLVGLILALGTKADTITLHDAQVSSCKRVNILRAQSNNSDLVSFRILSLSAQREQALTKLDSSNATSTHQKSSDLLAIQAGKLTMTALTDCNKAVNDPEHYQFPIANPIGDPRTGRLTMAAQHIVDESRKLLEDYRRNG